MNKVLKNLKDMTEFISASLYLLFLELFYNKARRVVLYYHGIEKDDIKSFRRQMVYLSSKCEVVKPSEILTKSTNENKIIVAITFDDAFTNVIENAVPILKDYQLPAGIFVPVNNLGQSPHWRMSEDCPDKKETVMSKEQIVNLDREGFEIFSHTLFHSLLTGISDEILAAELDGSKRALEDIVGHEVLGISYPFGGYDGRVCKAAEKAGYRYGFTIEPRLLNDTDEPLSLGRFSVSPRFSAVKFKLKVMGAYEVSIFFRKAKKIFLQKR